MVLHWSTAPFRILYDAIVNNDESVKVEMVSELSEDLTSLIIKKGKSDSSRKALETGEIKFTDGSVFKVNKNFIENAIQVADQLNLDESIAAEVLYFATSKEQKELGTSYIDSAVAAFQTRNTLLLQIVSYYLCSDTISTLLSNDSNSNNITSVSPDKKIFIDLISKIENYSTVKILKSFQVIENDLELLKQRVDRSKLLSTFHPGSKEMKTISYQRNLLFQHYQLLGEVLFGFISTFVKSNNGNNFTVENFKTFIDHMSTFDPEDVFLVCFLPAIFFYISQLDILPTKDVNSLHTTAMKEINDMDKLSETPMKSLVILIFLTYFIDWCKVDSKRNENYDFATAAEKPIQKCIQAGALEQLLCICADTSMIQTTLNNSRKPFYDFRSFLQQHIPKLLPVRLFDIDNDSKQITTLSLLQQGQKLSIANESFKSNHVNNENLKLDNHYTDFIVLTLSKFVHKFISTAAFVMTQLRDAEEDFLISSETFDLESLSENADLERLYMAIYYLYYSREQLISEIWADSNSSFYGFLQWASKCNSPLIMSTFSMLLSSLACGSDNAINLFHFLQMTNSNSVLLANPKHNSTLLTKYPSISWSTIYSTLNYYCDALTNATDSTLQTLSSTPVEFKSKGKIVTELGEDSIIYISGFFQVLSEVALNNEKARIELLESDNGQLLNILSRLLNMNTLLNGSVLTLISSLLGDSIEERKKVWQILDSWIFNNGRNSPIVNFPKEIISRKLVNYQHVCGFISLLKKLLSPLDTSNNILSPLCLPFSLDMGSAVRKPGIWCYLEFICTDLLPGVEYAGLSLIDTVSLKYDILDLLGLCIVQLDPEMVINSSACGVKDLDSIVETKSIIKYLQAHPGSAALTFLFKSNVMHSLLEICKVDVEEVYRAASDSPLIALVQKCLELFKIILKYDKFYSDELVSILRLPDNVFIDPTSINNSGAVSFCQYMLLNLPLLANISLFIGSNKQNIATLSLDLVCKVYNSKEFNTYGSNFQGDLVKRNKFLVMCDTIDESIRIRSSFIQQFSSEITDSNSLSVKLSLLQFICQNLDPQSKAPSISHFLLGFDTQRMDFGSVHCETTIASKRSFLRLMILNLKESLEFISNAQDLEYAPIKLSSLSMEILLKLCKSDVTCSLVFKLLHGGSNYLDDDNSGINYILWFAQHLTAIKSSIKFNGYVFNGTINTQNDFCVGGGLDTLNALILLKDSCLQLLAIELHNAVSLGEVSLLKKYKGLLLDTNFSLGCSRLLAMLDVLDYKMENQTEKVDSMFKHLKFDYIFGKVGFNDHYKAESPYITYDFEVIDSMLSLMVKSRSIDTIDRTLIEIKKEQLKKVVHSSILVDKFKATLLSYVASWCLLVQVITDEVDLFMDKRRMLIFDILQNVVPLIDEYLELDITFVQPLVSLCVRFFNLALVGKHSNDQDLNVQLERYFPMFCVAFTGITKSSAFASIRSDFYILCRRFADRACLNPNVLPDLGIFITSADPKSFDIIRHDSLVGEDSNRITSMMLLDSLMKLFSESRYFNEGFFFEKLCNENYICLLLEQLKHLDFMFTSPLSGTDAAFQRTLYDVTCLKTGFSLLTRVAQTRTGAQTLLSNDAFKIIKSCKILCVDPEFEFSLVRNYVDQPFLGNLLLPSGSMLSSGLNIHYELLIPVFRLLTTIIISLGPRNEECQKQAIEITEHFNDLIKYILKKDAFFEQEQASAITKGEPKNDIYLKELSNLVTLLYSLVH